jgi:poly(3-hydroxybutyrate) depolymerase
VTGSSLAAILAVVALGGAGPAVSAIQSAAPAPVVPESTCVAGRTLKNIPLLQCLVRFEQTDFTYYVYVPPSYDGRRTLPAVLLLHGGGGNGLDSISAWRQLAETNGILLIAPTLPTGPALEPKVHELLHTILASAMQQRKIDFRRIYLFGHSMGGVFGFDAALLDSETYAAAAVHAAAIDPEYDWIIKRAKRKLPIAIYVGDHDQFFSLDRTRRTRDVLAAAGFDVHYLEIPHHDHNYATVAGEVNRDAWTFFSQHSLPQ